MHQRGPADNRPLLGQPGDRTAAVLILRAGLQVAGRQDAAAVASLHAGGAQTDSSRLSQAIGSRALAIAARLIFAGPKRTTVRTDTGLAAAKIATEMLPASAAAWRYYGAALDDAGRLEEALDACDQALALDPDNGWTHNNRGVTLWHLGRLEDALVTYDKAVALDPDNDASHSNRAIALLALGRVEEALAACDRALALDPDNAASHEGKGIFLAVTGNLDAALVEFDTADRLNLARTGEGRTWAGAILWHRRDPAAARDRFAQVGGRVVACTPFHTAEMEAIALCGLGQHDKAEQRLLSVASHRAAGDRAQPQAIYDLLADPPMPGIDRLRAIIDNDNI
jgi:tetratricopeptide (TPR) repeat protein